MARNRRRGWRKPLSTALKLAISCGLLAWVLHKTKLTSVAHSLGGARPEWLALALALGFAATMVQATQWHRLLRAVGLDRTITRSLRIVFVGNTFNTFLPSSIGGDAARAVYISEQPGERPRGAAAVVLQRLLNFPGMVLLIGLGLAFTITSPAAARARPAALAGVVIGLGILGVALSPLLGRVGSASLPRLPGWKPLSASLRVLDGFRSQHADLAVAVARGAVFWSLTVLNQWCFIIAMGIHISPGYAALSVTLVNGLTMLPISINGFGAREGGYTALLAAGAGFATTAQAVSVGLLVGAQSLLFGLIGAGCLLTMRSTAPWARRVDAAAASVASLPFAAAGLLSVRRRPSSPGHRQRPQPQPGGLTPDHNNPPPAAVPAHPAPLWLTGQPDQPAADRPPAHRPPAYRPPTHRPPAHRPPAHRPLKHRGGKTMRVLMLAPEPVYSPRGTPISIINRCRALTALGHQVDLVTYPVGQDVVMPGLRFIRTPALPGLRQVRIGPSAAKLPLDALLLLVAARQLALRRYDVIHSHEEAGALGWLLQGIFRLPHLHDAHSDLPTLLQDYGFTRRHPVVLLAQLVERRVLATARTVIVVFPELRSAVRRQAPRTPVHVIHNTPFGQRVDPLLRDRLRARWGEDRPVILYAGSLEPYQRIPLLLEAMAIVRDAIPEARLVMVGGREEQVMEVRREASRLGVGEAVIFEGQRPSEEIPSYLAAADVLVSPRQDGNATPLKVYAYLQAAKPIVATRTASHLQVLDDQCAALVELTPTAIAVALLAVLREPGLSDRLSREAARRARDFGVEEYLRGTAAAYTDLGVPAPSDQVLRTMVASLGEPI